ncbi:hypothetical protein [Dactylosporangium sp. CA-233914]|uniref:hypothetical protein n=1 Tax=Dactylosporangium sp. CA-233914 TaxID=3239934 RepID=UPI003D93D033
MSSLLVAGYPEQMRSTVSAVTRLAAVLRSGTPNRNRIALPPATSSRQGRRDFVRQRERADAEHPT